MKKFRHVHRSVFLFLLLTPLTLFIYPIVVLTHVGGEVNRIYEGKEGYKKSMGFVGVFFLGLITLGIVPIVWLCRVSGKIGRAAKENGIVRPSTSGPSFFFLAVLFGWAVVTLIIGLCKFFHTLNKLEQKLNDDAAAEAVRTAEEDILPPAEEQPAPLPEPAPEPEEEDEEEKPEAIKEEAPAPFEYVTETPLPEPAPETPRSDIAAIYHVAGRQETRKWRVRVGGSDQPAKLFDSREEALAYAKGLAAKRRATVRVKK